VPGDLVDTGLFRNEGALTSTRYIRPATPEEYVKAVGLASSDVPDDDEEEEEDEMDENTKLDYSGHEIPESETPVNEDAPVDEETPAPRKAVKPTAAKKKAAPVTSKRGSK